MKLSQLFEEINDPQHNIDNKYPLAPRVLDGLQITDKIDNLESIKATLYDYKILDGIRQIPLSVFNGPKSVFYAKNDFDRSKSLAEHIKESGSISPLIIVIDSEGPYILEGSHRYVALYYLNKTYLPALVVIDESDE